MCCHRYWNGNINLVNIQFLHIQVHIRISAGTKSNTLLCTLTITMHNSEVYNLTKAKFQKSPGISLRDTKINSETTI